MNKKKLLLSLLSTFIVCIANIKATNDMVAIADNAFNMVSHFVVSPRDGYPVFVTLYPSEGKSKPNSFGKGKALCQGWLTSDTKITVETDYNLLVDTSEHNRVISSISIEPGKGKEQEGCAGQAGSKFQALSCLMRNVATDSFILKFETKKVTRATGNCTNGNADTKEIRLHGHYQQSDWDAAYFSISLKSVQETKEQVKVTPERMYAHVDVAIDHQKPEQLKSSNNEHSLASKLVPEKEQPEPHLIDELPEIQDEIEVRESAVNKKSDSDSEQEK